jgi:phosphoribosylaminoimidazole-succinocarboxamide synthase
VTKSYRILTQKDKEEIKMTNYIRKVSGDTSVKEIGVLEEPTPITVGIADFNVRPVFSAFDYGTITPPVPLDNSTIVLMAGFNFELLHSQGLRSHFYSLVDKFGDEVEVEECINTRIAPTTMRVAFVNRLKPEFIDGNWDYSVFDRCHVSNYVQPIEFISRNELPESSSVWKRVANGDLTLEDLSLPINFKPGKPLQSIMLDYSTKFEPDDRYISANEARKLMFISKERFDKINEKTKKASEIMTNYAENRGFRRLDGKVEFAVMELKEGKPEDVLADAVCTWHEDRLTWNGLGISKQRIRDEVKKVNPLWYADIQSAKRVAKKEGHADFHDLMNPNIKYTSPKAEFFQAINKLFQAATNQWVASKVYNPYPTKIESVEDTLNRAVEEFEKIRMR